jgi:SAM-dependent methyltransferase
MKRPDEADEFGFAYTGTSNLEAMAEAKRYNEFLVTSVAATFAPKTSILDFGAGIGTFALMLRDRGFTVAAVEPDDEQRNRLEIEQITAWGSTADIPDSTLDGAYTLNVLEHINDDCYALRELHRVLRPGAKLFIYVPAMPWLFTAMDDRVGHFRRYRRDELVEKVNAAGFDVDFAKYVDSVGVLATLAYRLLGSRDGEINPRAVAIYDRLVFPLSRVFDRLFERVGGKNLLLLATARHLDC